MQYSVNKLHVFIKTFLKWYGSAHIHVHVHVQSCIWKACSITPRVGRYLTSTRYILSLYFSLPFLSVYSFVPMDTTKKTVRENVRKLREPQERSSQLFHSITPILSLFAYLQHSCTECQYAGKQYNVYIMKSPVSLFMLSAVDQSHFRVV